MAFRPSAMFRAGGIHTVGPASQKAQLGFGKVLLIAILLTSPVVLWSELTHHDDPAGPEMASDQPYGMLALAEGNLVENGEATGSAAPESASRPVTVPDSASESEADSESDSESGAEPDSVPVSDSAPRPRPTVDDPASEVVPEPSEPEDGTSDLVSQSPLPPPESSSAPRPSAQGTLETPSAERPDTSTRPTVPRACTNPSIATPGLVPTPLGGRGQFSSALRRAWSMVEHAHRLRGPDALESQSPTQWAHHSRAPWQTRRRARIQRAAEALNQATPDPDAGALEQLVHHALRGQLHHAYVAAQTQLSAPSAVLNDRALCDQYLGADDSAVAAARQAYQRCVQTANAGRGPEQQILAFCRRQQARLP